jgi:hypothetical protein
MNCVESRYGSNKPEGIWHPRLAAIRGGFGRRIIAEKADL